MSGLIGPNYSGTNKGESGLIGYAPSDGISAPTTERAKNYLDPLLTDYVSMGSGGTHYDIDTLGIPASGVWRVEWNLRIGWCSFGSFCRAYLHDGTSGTNSRMIFERMTQTGCNGNINLSFFWMLDVKTGNTFPQTLRLHIYQYQASGTLFSQQDTNGRDVWTIFKIRETRTGGTGIAQIGY